MKKFLSTAAIYGNICAIAFVALAFISSLAILLTYTEAVPGWYAPEELATRLFALFIGLAVICAAPAGIVLTIDLIHEAKNENE